MYKQFFLAAALLACSSASSAQMRPNADALFEKADANHDGSVSRSEFLAARAQQFPRLDRNGDGFIDAEDAPKRMMARQQGNAQLAELRKHFDTDGDGRISQQELAQGPTTVFDLADTDHDGVLNARELAAAKEVAKSRAAAMRQG
ncbi:MAG: EF-hand domain-containing protein [Steroidobacteraceae bacterium]